MKYVFIGGAGEVGASCLLVFVADRKILIDCGVAVKPQNTSLPNLTLLRDLAPTLDAIFISHAHADHVGALPIVHQMYPDAPIYMTEVTQALAYAMLKNTAWLQSSEDRQLYPPRHVLEALTKPVRSCPVQHGAEVPWIPLEYLGDDWAFMFKPSGHIFGAVSIVLQTPEGRFLYSGDVSAFKQRTVDGIGDLSGLNPDFMWCEATYGDANHPARSIEERNLAESVASIVEGGGTVLIPSFALGRAQEIILILKSAMLSGAIPRFPVITDGLVNEICHVYQEYYLQASKSFRAIGAYVRKKNGIPNIFFGSPVRAAPRNRRDLILEDPTPKCIIASSGMLNGGASVEYAKALAPGKRNAIFLSGYQDAESPGRRLQGLKAGEKLEFTDGTTVEVKCRIQRFHLSAHSDQRQLIQMIQQVNPKALALVHGERTTIQTLREKLQEKGFPVAAPLNGTLEDETGRSKWEELIDFLTVPTDVRSDGRIKLEIDSKEAAENWQEFLKSETKFSTVIHGDYLIIRNNTNDDGTLY